MARFWGKKPLTTDQLDVYYEKLQPIPQKPWWEIIDYAIDTCRSFPSRGELWDCWIDWQRSNPDKVVKPEHRKECDACDSKGFIEILYIPKWVRKWLILKGKDPSVCWEDSRVIYEGVMNCGICRQPEFASKVVRFVTPEQIDSDPWTIIKKLEDRDTVVIRNLDTLATMATHGMDQDSLPF